MTLSEALTNAIRGSGQNQKEVAREVGIPESTLSKDRKHNRFPKTSRFLALCKKLDLGGSIQELEQRFEFAWRSKTGLSNRADLLSRSPLSSPAGYFGDVLKSLPENGIAHIESFTWEHELPEVADSLLLWYLLIDMPDVVVRHFTITPNSLLPMCMVAMMASVKEAERKGLEPDLQEIAGNLLRPIQYNVPDYQYSCPPPDDETLVWLKKHYIQYTARDIDTTFTKALKSEPLSYFLFQSHTASSVSNRAFYLSCPKCFGEINGEGVTRVERRFDSFINEENFKTRPQNEMTIESMTAIAASVGIVFADELERNQIKFDLT